MDTRGTGPDPGDQAAPKGYDYGIAPAGAGDGFETADGADGAEGPAASPPSARPRRSRRIVLVASLGVAALVAAVALGVGVLRTEDAGPEAAVDAYLTALEEGRFGDAALLGGLGEDPQNGALLTDEMGAATGGLLDEHEIVASTQDEDTARVTVAHQLGNVRSERTYTLHRTEDQDGSAGSVDGWALDEIKLDPIEVQIFSTVPAVEINGIEVGLDGMVTEMDEHEGGERALLPAFPGTYELSYGIEGTEYIASLPSIAEVTVIAHGVAIETWPEWELTSAAKAEIHRQVAEQLDGCVAQGVAHPEGCPFAAPVGATTPGTWTIEVAPEVTIEELETGLVLVTSPPDSGTALFSYLDTESGRYDPRVEVRVTFGYNGTVSWTDGGDMMVIWDGGTG